MEAPRPLSAELPGPGKPCPLGLAALSSGARPCLRAPQHGGFGFQNICKDLSIPPQGTGRCNWGTRRELCFYCYSTRKSHSSRPLRGCGPRTGPGTLACGLGTALTLLNGR